MKNFDKMTTSEKMQLALKVRDWSASLDVLNEGCLFIGIDKAKEDDKDYSAVSLCLWHDGLIDVLYSTCEPEIVKALENVNNNQLKSIEEIGLGTKLQKSYPVRPIKYLKWNDLRFDVKAQRKMVKYKGNTYEFIYEIEANSDCVYLKDIYFNHFVYTLSCNRSRHTADGKAVITKDFDDMELEVIE